MSAPEIIRQLVAKFTENRDAYRSGKYNEARLRQEFLDPFFEALGWDVYNRAGVAPDYADVVIEDSLEIEGAGKNPDYAFKIGRERKFYVEAKKPRVDIQYDIHPAFQLRRYAWNAGLPLSILTDFEEMAVYNCKNKPNPSDSAATARDKFYRYTDYVEKWDEIAAIFSRDAVWKGSFDRFAASSKGKKGTTGVDDAILTDIEEWRKLLAQNIALRNQGRFKGERQLNYAVQMTIDRILFLRICEDRGIEPDEQLKDLGAEPNIYPRLVELFRRADKKYNSGLFHFEKEKENGNPIDTFTPSLTIDDRVLKDIINRVYYPCPYIFKEIPVEILGQVYEQFLGSVIHLTPSGQARIDVKPEVRKAGGVYYTPQYIVDYIVANTVGKLLEGKTPGEAAALKIVDPACGSGSFLLGAYQYLLDWHEDWYAKNDPEKWTTGKDPALMPAAGGGYRLTTQKRKQILVSNIHGVDIDPQAVEVTKLSLLLKVLEEESGQLTLGFERALPDLGRNIQCGNSLIGPDYFDGQLVIDEAERRRVNPFDWPSAFPEVFARGGFDAVIGNPPYIRIQAMNEWAPSEVEFYKIKYEAANRGNYDIYVVFIEKGLNLLNPEGLLGFILPHKFFNSKYGEPIRKIIANGKNVQKIVHFGDKQVFENATTYTCLLFLSKNQQDAFYFTKVTEIEEWINKGDENPLLISTSLVNSDPWILSANSKPTSNLVILNQYSKKIFQGLATSADAIYVLEVKTEGEKIDSLVQKASSTTVEIESELMHPLLKGAEISRYKDLLYKYKVLFPYRIVDGKVREIAEKELAKDYPLAYDYLRKNKYQLLKRSKCDNSNWWLFPYPKNLTLYNEPKILSQVLSNRGNFALDSLGKFYFLGGGTAGGNGILGRSDGLNDLLFLLGILNSKYCTHVVKQVGSSFRGGYFAFGKSSLANLQIPQINNNLSGDVNRHDQMVALVTRMLDLHKRVPATPFETEQLARDIAATDRAIDTLVYDLYALTPAEIRLIES